MLHRGVLIPGRKEGHLCFDATRRFDQLGRYINHAQRPNAKVTRPFKIRGKWRVGFLAVRDIEKGDEVVWDYGVRGVEWSGCRLVGGVVKTGQRVGEAGEVPQVVVGPASHATVSTPVGGVPKVVQEPAPPAGGEKLDVGVSTPVGGVPKVVQEPAPPAGGEKLDVGVSTPVGGVPKVVQEPAPPAGGERVDEVTPQQPPKGKSKKKTYSMCPLCGTGPHSKISNHLIQTHKVTNKKNRAKYLFGNRLIATPEQMKSKVKKPVVLRRSQRTIIAAFKKVAEGSGEASEVVEISDSESSNSPTPSPGDSGAEDSAPPSPSATRSVSPKPPTSTTVVTEESDLPGPSSACLTGKSTRNAPRFDLSDPFLECLREYLASRLGGSKDPIQLKEICVDISKFLHLIDPRQCNPDHLMSRASIRRYVAWLEAGGIGASGVATKLRRVQMAIKCLGLQHEDLDTEVEFNNSKDMVWELLTSLITSLGRQKRKTQAAKLDQFAHNIPDLEELGAWLTSLRPLFVQEESPLMFCSRSGAPLVQISHKLSELAKDLRGVCAPCHCRQKGNRDGRRWAGLRGKDRPCSHDEPQ